MNSICMPLFLTCTGGAITLKEVEKPYQHIVKSETETTEHMKSTGMGI